MMRTVAGDHARFEQTYFSHYKGYYFTGDGARRDEDGCASFVFDGLLGRHAAQCSRWLAAAGCALPPTAGPQLFATADPQTHPRPSILALLSCSYYWILGRVDDVINVSGHRIGTAEVESALVGHHLCAEAAVVPVDRE